jgi:4-amino-4-deoxychorismate lyase
VDVRYVIGPAGSIDAQDRGLAYGDGLFETMSVCNGEIERLGLHLQRLYGGAARLSIPLPDLDELTLKITASAAGTRRGVLKLILTRGCGPRGYAVPAVVVPTIVLSATEVTARADREISVATLKTRLGENPALAGIKHLGRLEQVLGRLELSELGADEGLMLSSSGNVISGTSRNLFAVFRGSLVTPALGRAGVAGVMRRAIVDHCPTLGIPVDEADIVPGDLLKADEIFMTNALVGIQSVTQLDSHHFVSQSVANRLRQSLQLDRDD